MSVRIASARWEDGPDLIAAHRDSMAWHAPWTKPFIDRTGFEAWFARVQDESVESFVARSEESRAIVGLITLSQIFRHGFQNAYLGYHGARSTAGRGLMTQAVRLVVAQAFGPLGLHRLEANIQPGNRRSIALVRRLGFRMEGFSPRYLMIDGEWRDHERWAVLADEWPQADQPGL